MASKTTRHPSKLISLPPIIWAQVTALLDCRSIVTFSLTCPLVRNLLRSPLAVTRFHINILGWSDIKLIEFPFEWFEHYPSLLSIGLSINWNSKLRLFTKEDLTRFPATLRHLHLNFPDSLNDELLNYLPRMLSTLHLDKNFRITDEGIRNLPEWLEVLHLPNNIKLSSRCIPYLPKTLKSLSIRVSDDLTPQMVAQMPPLTTFHYHGTHVPSSTAIAALPKTLTNFGWFISFRMGQMDVMMLPESVTSLTAEKLETRPEIFRQLPTSLKRLTIYSHTYDYNVECIKCMPRGLQYLELSSAPSFIPADCEALPPTLLSLVLPAVTQMQAEGFSKLPSSLHTLRLPSLANFSDDQFSTLPPHLHVFSCTWNEKITQEFIQKAPKELFRLILRSLPASYEEVVAGLHTVRTLFMPPIDDYIPLAAQFPRQIRSHAQISKLSPYDLYYFDVDVPNQKLGIHDISPRTVPGKPTPLPIPQDEPSDSAFQSFIGMIKGVFGASKE